MANFFKSLFSSSKAEQAVAEEQTPEPPKNFDTLKYDGVRAQRMGRIGYATKCYQEALLLMKDYETMQFLASAYTQTHDLEDALEVTTEMTELEPDNKDGYLLRINLLYMMERLEESLQQVLILIDRVPDLTEAYYMKGKVELDMKRAEDAIVSLTEGIRLKEDAPQMFFVRAKAYYVLKNLEAAIKDIDQALTLNPEDESYYLLKGLIHQDMQDDESAVQNYLKVTELNPFSHQVALSIGNIYMRTNRAEEALELYDDLLEMGEEFPELHDARAQLFDQLGQSESAQEEREKADLLRKEAVDEEEVTDGKANFDNLYKGGFY